LMPERKKLIEVALPLEAINIASSCEKSIRHGHPSTLHIWWARRPLAACRAVLFSSIVDDPSSYIDNEAAARVERKRLHAIIEKLVVWENSNDPKVLNDARLEIARSVARSKGEMIPDTANPEEVLKYIAENAPPVLDPFCGGGSIPLEAQRLGLKAYASDLNPVAVLITKALVEIPPKFAGRSPVNSEARKQKSILKGGWEGAQGLAADLRYYGEWVRQEAEKRIGHLYPKMKLSDGKDTTVIAWLWARTVKCPNPACRATMPLVRSFWLSNKVGKKAWVEPMIDRTSRTVRFTVKMGGGEAPEGTVHRKGARCAVCDAPVPFNHVRSEGKAGRMNAQLMAIITEGDSGRHYSQPNQEHEQIAHLAQPIKAPETNLPEQALSFRVQLYGMTRHRDLFTFRQLVALTTFSDLVGEARQRVLQDAKNAGVEDDGILLDEGGLGALAYADAIATYLAFSLDKCSDYWNTLATWMPRGTIGHAFSKQALPMTWDFSEANPFAEFHCAWHKAYDWVSKVLEESPLNVQPGVVRQVDAAVESVVSSPLYSTDPPYYDNIGYADLSDFFYVWLRRSLGEIYPQLFATLLTPKRQELIASPYRHDGSTEAAQSFFESGLVKVFNHISKTHNPLFPLTVYYAFKQTETDEDVTGSEEAISSTGWETMLEGLLSAHFTVVGTWPIRTERQARSVGIGTNALASSIVLVCRPRQDGAPMATRREVLAALKSELPDALKELQDENIAPVDFAQASIGPGIAIFSRYSKIVEPDGSAMSVRTALQIINQELDSFLRQEEGEMDAETQFCVQWFEQYGMNQGPFGEADVLARAKATSVDGIARSGAINSRGGKVAIRPRSEYPHDWDPVTDSRISLWECAQYLIKRYQEDGETLAAELATKLGVGRSEDAKNLAYRLYSVCERKGWAEDAMPYNELVTAWPEIQRKAAGITGAGPQKILDVGAGRRGKK